ncbi:hypothetical protein [Pararhizobium haloflavum]|uniref:hypothetical protein n=1 Tax=Pararhizobium haloflavum TaxID=2037914 RepID=UPI000C1916F8|nr:hypothetical protein [Pararhizobium haloflavum]
MTIERHEGRLQVSCNHCPASYPATYAEEDFPVMVADAMTAGWKIRKVDAAAAARRGDGTADLFGTPAKIAGSRRHESYTHTCPACADRWKGSQL